MRTWLFDLGNSRLKFAPLHADGGIGEVVAVDHDGAGFAAGWEQRMPDRFDAASLASVAAPALRVVLIEALAARCGRLSVACTLARCDGVAIAYADPRRLGVDRFLALLAAHARGPGPSLVVGVGTALTIDLLDGSGRHHGGRIAPSPALMREALHARAAQLPADGGSYAEFAAETRDALASGCEGAALALLERSREAARAMLGVAPRLLLHGGGAAALAGRLDGAEPAPTLVLEGLAHWARMEREPV
ncbi:type III pantothenate kinase [Luteimonas sp. RD2P54]|uniref:Type III pantothenate kinase n=1 Tax=Luteimonas endophytica TaxID=3042023 RepID=A0ABT6J8G9_9GAMM|nr:type III pantothenate kinase [Luteimonas endophytica]MDH5823054.1 type III pantothenate kinase [Luteimonas endophytica]